MYYPKSKISEDQYTSGNQFVMLSTKKPYKGIYYATFDNRYFSGSPTDSNPAELQKLIVNNTPGTTKSMYFRPTVTTEDMQRGFITRYFIKRVNSGVDTIKEVSITDYNKFKSNPLYVGVNLEWKITGPLYDNKDSKIPVHGIIDTNMRTVKSKETIVPGLSIYLVNLAEFSNQNL